MLAAIRHRRQSRRAVTAIEYGLIAAAIIVAVIGALRLTSADLDTVFGKVGNGLTSATQTVFGTFETVTGATGTGFCPGSNISGFSSSDGIISLNTCGTRAQSTVYSDLTSNTPGGYGAAIISNPASGQPITVPALQGPGTGFTIPANGYAKILKSQSGAASSFRIYSYNNAFDSTNTASAATACAAEGGTLYGGSYSRYCSGGTLYTGTQIAAALPPQ